MKSIDELIDDLLTLAFAEDVGDGDHTTLSTIPADAKGRQRLIVKEEGILAGVEIARRVFEKFDPSLKMTEYIGDGTRVRPGDIAFEVSGSVLQPPHATSRNWKDCRLRCLTPARQHPACACSKKWL